MTRNKSRSETDHLRNEIKKLKKKLTRKNKNYYETPEEQEISEEVEEKKNIKSGCPKCGSALDIIGGSKVKIYICQDCPYRVSVRT